METVRLVLLGSGGVGKSCITIRYVQDSFVTEYDPTIEDSYRRQTEVDGQQVMLEILDTAGTEQFTAMRDLYMKNGDGFVLVYSIISRSTFDDLPDLRQQILQVKDEDDVPLALVGNKCDMESFRQVSREEGERLAKKWGPMASFFETSAKSNLYVKDLFGDITKRIVMERNKASGGKKRRNPNSGKAHHKCTLF